MNIIIFSTGSNIGDSLSHLKFASKRIDTFIGKILAISKIYKSEAWGNNQQQDFLNQVIIAETKYNAIECLDIIQKIEKDRKRVRKDHWGPRTLDIDILFFNKEIINSHRLTIPHPFIPERLFVLLPLSKISGEYIHPELNQDIHTLLKNCKDNSAVKLYNNGL